MAFVLPRADSRHGAAVSPLWRLLAAQVTPDPRGFLGCRTMPKLHDGREVASDSEEWRHTCEAHAINRLPTLQERRAWLEAIEKRRGKAEADRLRKTMLAVWGKGLS